MLYQTPRVVVDLVRAEFPNQRLASFEFISGGCINSAAKFTLDNKVSFFVKWNRADSFPNMFEKEAQGLSLLKRTDHSLLVPKVLGVFSEGGYDFLLLEFIDHGDIKKDFWEGFGTGLAELHQNSNTYFGLASDNFIGSLTQSNRKNSSWIDFFIEERLLPQMKLATQNHVIDCDILKLFDNLLDRMPELLKEEKPSLLHGDLWSGNFMVNRAGHPVIFDPAVYYGNREIEIAFTSLFGGFDKRFYQAYHDVLPLEEGFSERKEIYNLYPLLVHLNLFGSSYLHQIVFTLKQFC